MTKKKTTVNKQPETINFYRGAEENKNDTNNPSKKALTALNGITLVLSFGRAVYRQK